MEFTITLIDGSFFLLTEDGQGELELGDSFEICLDSLFAIRGDEIDNDKLKELITELHEICE